MGLIYHCPSGENFSFALSPVIKIYFNMPHTVIIMIFYSLDSFNIWTYDSFGIKNKEGGLFWWY